MNIPKSINQQETFTFDGLHRLTKLAKRTIIDRLDGIKPDELKNGRFPAFKLATVWDKLQEKVNNKDVPTDLKSKKLTEEIRKLKLANDTRDKLLIARKLIAAEWIRIFAPALKEVEHKLVNEYPTVVAGIGVPEARVYGKRVMDFILAAHKESAEKWEA